MKQVYEIYTDGSCLGNPGPGGWAYLLLDSQRNQIMASSGGESHTTNNRMEMMALIKALEYLEGQSPNFSGSKFNIYSDSNLLIQTINSGWKKKANLDLWSQIDRLIAKFELKFQWVKAHAGNQYNEIVDEMANQAATKQ